MKIDILAECRGAKRIGISGHVRPDGDCISSCLALRRYLEKNLEDVQVSVYLDLLPRVFHELCGYDEIITGFPKVEDPFDIYIALDCNLERLGPAGEYFLAAGKRINLDHHISNSGCGDVNVVEPDLSATAELLCTLFEKDKMDKEIATALYVGMIHDSGVFQYSCTSPDTMRRAADLMEFGVDFPRIIKETFYQKTYLQTQIMGRVLMESVRFMDDRCVVGWVDRKTADFYKVLPKEYEGIVNQLINVKGIDCAIFMYETEPMEWKISLRSSERVDVSEIVSHFGGGGHVRAAGCTLKGTLHDCVNNLSEFVEIQLDGKHPNT